MQKNSIAEIASEMRAVESILFITGAGLSADSGLPTYRGQSGLYTNADPEEGIPIEEILSGYTLKSNPELTWKYLFEIEKSCRGAQFNEGHRLIAEIEKRFPRVWTLTQNIDSFHTDAGSKNIIEIHGSFRDILCTNCDYQAEIENYESLECPPLCPLCQAHIRPGIVLFGEQLPFKALQDYGIEISSGFDMVFSIGTSSRFPYITDPVLAHYQAANTTIEINPEPTEISRYTHFQLRMSAADALNKIWKELNNV
jgi:NAD-dependent deacetylase